MLMSWIWYSSLVSGLSSDLTFSVISFDTSPWKRGKCQKMENKSKLCEINKIRNTLFALVIEFLCISHWPSTTGNFVSNEEWKFPYSILSEICQMWPCKWNYSDPIKLIFKTAINKILYICNKYLQDLWATSALYTYSFSWKVTYSRAFVYRQCILLFCLDLRSRYKII